MARSCEADPFVGLFPCRPKGVSVCSVVKGDTARFSVIWYNPLVGVARSFRRRRAWPISHGTARTKIDR